MKNWHPAIPRRSASASHGEQLTATFSIHNSHHYKTKHEQPLTYFWGSVKLVVVMIAVDWWKALQLICCAAYAGNV